MNLSTAQLIAQRQARKILMTEDQIKLIHMAITVAMVNKENGPFDQEQLEELEMLRQMSDPKDSEFPTDPEMEYGWCL